MIVVSKDGTVSERKYDGTIGCIYEAGNFDVFDIVRLRNGVTMFVDDNGLLKPGAGACAEINWKATYLRMNAWMENPKEIDWRAARTRIPPIIVGDVVLLVADFMTGETLDLDNAQRKQYLELLGESVEEDV